MYELKVSDLSVLELPNDLKFDVFYHKIRYFLFLKIFANQMVQLYVKIVFNTFGFSTVKMVMAVRDGIIAHDALFSLDFEDQMVFHQCIEHFINRSGSNVGMFFMDESNYPFSCWMVLKLDDCIQDGQSLGCYLQALFQQ